jgi:ubiquinone/menaquinone biosynthesis C-methylase UbiE
MIACGADGDGRGLTPWRCMIVPMIGSEAHFAPIAHALRDHIIEHYRDRGLSLHDDAGLRTLDTNSTLAAQRAELLLEALGRAGRPIELAGSRVVDLGCGFGALSVYFAARGASVTGIDPNGERLEVGIAVAREFGLDASFRRGWLEDLVLPDQSVELAVLNNSLCYVVKRSDRRRALRNVHRVLVSGGQVVLRNPSRSAPLDPFTRLPLVHQVPPAVAQRLLSRRRPPRSPVRLRTAGGLSRELRRAGLADVHAVNVGESRLRPPRYQHHVAARKRQIK